MTESFPNFLTDTQNHALRAICDKFVPSLEAADDPNRFYGLGADDVELAGRVAATIAHLPDEENRQAAKLLLTLFENRLFNLLTTGHFARFSEMPLCHVDALALRAAETSSQIFTRFGPD